jgi:hypothetical protein
MHAGIEKKIKIFLSEKRTAIEMEISQRPGSDGGGAYSSEVLNYSWHL